jgi:NADH dehydrogenase FAD-containing subunit
MEWLLMELYTKASKKLVLIGGGHAHVYLLHKLRFKKPSDFSIIMISLSDRQYYSGMASAFLEEVYIEKDIYFDLKALCLKSGVTFIQNRVTGINKEDRKISMSNGDTLNFDILSLDTGSIMKDDGIHGINEFAEKIKPLTNLSKIKNDLIHEMKDHYCIVIVGGGAAGVEISLSLRALARKLKKDVRIIILNRGSIILKDSIYSARKKALNRLQQMNIEILCNRKIIAVNSTEIELQDKEFIEYDYLVWATGPASDPLYRKSGFTTDSKGYILVNKYLQSVDCPFIFGAGDCISLENNNHIPKSGVFAIKEAPFLYNNIFKYINNIRLRKYIPQKYYLSVIYMGDKKGLLQYYNFSLYGTLSWLIKYYIDRKFMKNFK